MQLNHPLATITPTLDGDVLMLLARHDGTFTTAQLQRVLSAYSEEGIRKVLKRLSRQGVVQVNRVGNAYSYRLNTEHLAAASIVELARLQRTLLARLENRLAKWALPPIYAAVFGSAARGDMSPESDLDLFLVAPEQDPGETWSGQVAALTHEVSRWTGNDMRAHEYTVDELRRRPDEPVVQDVLRDGLTVAGSRAWLQQQLRERRS